MNNLDKQYTDLLQDILDNGVSKEDRTGTGTISVFGRQIRHDMKDGFPLLTTKKMPFKSIVTELLWFLGGRTDLRYLLENKCYIWTGDAYKVYDKEFDLEHPPFSAPYPHRLTIKEFEEKIMNDDDFNSRFGDLGPIYGKQWRSWNTGEITTVGHNGLHTLLGEKVIDQIQNLIEEIKDNPDSRRLMVSAWNVSKLSEMTLPPCHYGFQVYTRELSENERINLLHIKNGNKGHHIEAGFNMLDEFNIPTRAISLMWNQRSVDTFLGLPFNIASYGLLLEMLADEMNMVPDQLIGNLGDVHLYSNHIDAAKEQIGRDLTLEERFELAGNQYPPGGLPNQAIHFMNEKGIPKRTREPFPLPTIHVRDGMYCSSINDVLLFDYISHEAIKAPLSN